jgi:hypothetical protein
LVNFHEHSTASVALIILHQCCEPCNAYRNCYPLCDLANRRYVGYSKIRALCCSKLKLNSKLRCPDTHCTVSNCSLYRLMNVLKGFRCILLRSDTQNSSTQTVTCVNDILQYINIILGIARWAEARIIKTIRGVISHKKKLRSVQLLCCCCCCYYYYCYYAVDRVNAAVTKAMDL